MSGSSLSMLYDVRRLRLLRELARHGTIAATAAACHLTPSAVSQQLALLEREVGTSLLLRDGRRLVLTEAARVLVERAERVLAELEGARADVAALSESVRGRVRLSTFPSAAVALAAPAIAACRAAHPDLRIQLDEGEPDECATALHQHGCDVALVYEYDLLPRFEDQGIQLTPVLDEPLLVAVPPDLALSGPVQLAELAATPWIAPSSDAALRSVLERACATAGFEPRLDYTSDDYTVIMSLVQAGLGVALMPRLIAEPLQLDVRLCEIAGLRLTRTVSVAVRAGSAHAPAIAALTAELHTVAAQLGPGGGSDVGGGAVRADGGG